MTRKCRNCCQKIDIILTNNEECLEPQLIYGYFPCTAEGNSIHVYDPSVIEQGLTPQIATPVVTWTFPRQKSLRRLCLADFFRPLSENKFDVFPMQAVTMGEVASEAETYVVGSGSRTPLFPDGLGRQDNAHPTFFILEIF